MMDHAADIAQRIGDLLHAYPGRKHFVSRPVSGHDRSVLVAYTDEGECFRITIDNVGFEGLSRDEDPQDQLPIWLRWTITEGGDA